MKVLVCGDRYYNDKGKIKLVLKTLMKPVTTVIQGECDGADVMGRDAAREMGIHVMSFPANWAKYHRAAGPIRNKQMLDEGQPELILAFHDNINRSKGTRNMIVQSLKYEIPVFLYQKEEVYRFDTLGEFLRLFN